MLGHVTSTNDTLDFPIPKVSLLFRTQTVNFLFHIPSFSKGFLRQLLGVCFFLIKVPDSVPCDVTIANCGHGLLMHLRV